MMKTKITAIIIIAASLLCLCATGCAGSASGDRQQYRQQQGTAWGTVYHITYSSDHDLSQTIAKAIDDINNTLSPFVETSEISKINRGEINKVGLDFKTVFTLSQQICSISGGAFDPTVAPLVNLWGFGYGKAADGYEPDDAQIDSALQAVGIMQCHIDESGTLTKKSASTEFNFSAIAKGYGVDKIARALKNSGCDNYMVEVGGEINVAGKSPRGAEWRIQIDAPVPDSLCNTHERMGVIQLTDGAVATSGNYRNYHLIRDKMMGHTISPETGRPIETNTLSATVIAQTCTLADGLATAAMAMPDSTAIAMITALPHAEAMLVVARGDTFEIKTTPGFSFTD